MLHRSPAFLADIALGCENLVRLTQSVNIDAFDGPSDFARLVERHLEIVGEAQRRLKDYDPDTFQRIRLGDEYIALRKVIAHGYELLNYEAIRFTCQSEIPLVLDDARTLLSPPLVS